MLPLAERHDLRLGTGVHPVQVQAKQKRLHCLEISCKVIDAAVRVMLVVNDANVLAVVMLPQVLADRDQVLWFAAPSAVVIESDFAFHLTGCFNQRQHLIRGCFDAVFLSLTV